MKKCEPYAVISWKRRISLCAVVLMMTTAGLSQTVSQTVTPTAQRANRITQELSAGPIVTLMGTLHPLTQRATDLGAVNSDMSMDSLTLNIGLSAAQQTELKALNEAQQDSKSAQYHRWLTQEEYGARFGLTDADLSKVTGWLEAQGFTVRAVANSRNAITFSGKAWQVESAFHTQLHQFQLDGVTQFANTTELRVPAALASVLLNVRGLNSFRLKPGIRSKPMPAYTIGTNQGPMHFLSPGDWATIYNVDAIYSSGYTGSGTHVGVVGQTYAPQADIDHFRSASGLPATHLTYKCISSAHCNDAAGTDTDGNLAEADLDIEWAGGVAKDATVDFIYASFADTTQDVSSALQYAIQSYTVSGSVVPVLSMSYSDCELNITASDAKLIDALGTQAGTQGQTILVAAGDSGAAGCDAHGDPANVPAKFGASAGVPGDSPHYTSVGGTYMFDDVYETGYWNEQLNLVDSALAYIPEKPWNDTTQEGLAAGGGGVSTLFPQPSWQPTPSNYSGTPGRFQPDVSFSASMHDGYMTCSQAGAAAGVGTPCSNGFLTSEGYFFYSGGTSAGTPSFAGMLTLLTQKFGKQGNVNPTLYNLAADAKTYAKVFHDIVDGNTLVPCVVGTTGCPDGVMGYSSAAGYDLATGLGSVNGGALYDALAGVTAPTAPTTTGVSASDNSVATDGYVTFTANLSVPASNPNFASGTITFKVNNTTVATSLVLGNDATAGGLYATEANGFKIGRNTITAIYSGDENFASSSGTTTVTVTGAQGVSVTVSLSPSWTFLNGKVSATAAVTSLFPETITGSITFQNGNTTFGTATLSNGTATVNNIAVTNANGFTPPWGWINATYSGDANYASSSGSNQFAITPFTSTMTLTATPSSVPTGGGTALTATVTGSGGGAITGNVSFSLGSTVIGDSSIVNGTATYVASASPANGFSTGPNTIMANYQGGGNYATSSASTTVTMTAAMATYTLVPSTTAISIGPGGPAAVTLNLASPNYAGKVAFSVVSSNALSVSGSAVSATLTPNGSTMTGSSTLVISISGGAANHAPALPWKSGGAVIFAVLVGIPFTGRRRRALAVLLVAAAVSLVGLLMACGGGGGSTKAARVYTLTVTPTGTVPVANPAAVTVTVTVQ
jgi:hypothetical protein